MFFLPLTRKPVKKSWVKIGRVYFETIVIFSLATVERKIYRFITGSAPL